MIEVQNMTAVLIDGVSAGCVADAFANNREQSAAIQDALMAFEQGLREQINTLQTDLKTAQDAVVAAEAKAAEDVAKAQQDAATAISAAQADAAKVIEQAQAAVVTAQDNAAATINEIRTKAAAEVNSVVIEANQKIAAANDETKKANANCLFAQQLQQLHWKQSQMLMENYSEAAVAVLKEIQKMEDVEATARLEARKAALAAT